MVELAWGGKERAVSQGKSCCCLHFQLQRWRNMGSFVLQMLLRQRD